MALNLGFENQNKKMQRRDKGGSIKIKSINKLNYHHNSQNTLLHFLISCKHDYNYYYMQVEQSKV